MSMFESVGAGNTGYVGLSDRFIYKYINRGHASLWHLNPLYLAPPMECILAKSTVIATIIRFIFIAKYLYNTN